MIDYLPYALIVIPKAGIIYYAIRNNLNRAAACAGIYALGIIGFCLLPR